MVAAFICLACMTATVVGLNIVLSVIETVGKVLRRL